MASKIITEPAVEPVTLAEAKAHLRVDTVDDNLFITSLIIDARQGAETKTRRVFVTQTWTEILDEFPATIILPYPPLQSVTHIKYIDANGTQQTMSSADYIVDTQSAPARITPAFGKSWPGIQSRINAVEIQFVAGYGLAAVVPQKIKQWMLLTIGTRHEHRESIITGTIVNTLPDYDSLLEYYIVR